jgi:hypothetical protein
MLTVTDRKPLRWGWTRASIPQKKLLLRGWQALATQAAPDEQ